MTKYTVKMQIRYVPLPPEKEASYRAALRLLWKLLSSSPNPSPDSRTPDAATLSEHDPASEPGDGVPPALSLGNNGGASREVSPAGQGEGLATEETPLRERYAAEIHGEILNSAEAI